TRERFTRYFFGDAPFQPSRYHLIFHTGWVPLDDVVACVAALVRGTKEDCRLEIADCRLEDSKGPGHSICNLQSPICNRVLTLSRELGAGGANFVVALAGRLDLVVHDRELLEQEAIRLGVSEAEVRKVDEKPSGIFQRFRPGSIQQRYFEALGQLMNDLAAR